MYNIKLMSTILPTYTTMVRLKRHNMNKCGHQKSTNKNFTPLTLTHAGFTGSSDIRWDIWTHCQHNMGQLDGQRSSCTLHVSLVQTAWHAHTGFAGPSDIQWGTWRGYQHNMGHLDGQQPSYTLNASLKTLNRSSEIHSMHTCRLHWVTWH